MTGRRLLLATAMVAGLVGIALILIGTLERRHPPGLALEPAPVTSDSGAAGATSPTAASDGPAISGPTATAERVGGIAELADPQWLRAMARATGIGERALAAYTGATMLTASENPGCGLDWASLAAIGYVESRHGTLQGGTIDPAGRQRPPIYGIALDGSRSARLPDTDGGSLDDDAVWDRAVGPMQFIPQTWRSWGTDGNGDGVADPQQIDDAALAAARYLCAAGGDLTSSAGWITAVSAYNDSTDYNHLVAAATDGYRSAASSAP